MLTITVSKWKDIKHNITDYYIGLNVKILENIRVTNNTLPTLYNRASEG